MGGSWLPLLNCAHGYVFFFLFRDEIFKGVMFFLVPGKPEKWGGGSGQVRVFETRRSGGL